MNRLSVALLPGALLSSALASAMLTGCLGDDDRAAPVLVATAGIEADLETDPVSNGGDAADDPAIWVNLDDPAQSLLLGTNKRSGLDVFGLDGARRQFLAVGALNNVDLRQDVRWDGRRISLAAASNRTDDTVVLFEVDADGAREIGRFASQLPEPYGLCLGAPDDGETLVVVTHKSGDLIAYRPTGPEDADIVRKMKFSSQLEGCVFDDPAGRLYIGEEAVGVHVVRWDANVKPELIDPIGGVGGLVADVEGLAVYGPAETGFLVVSSQGDDSFAVYDRSTHHKFVGRFRIVPGVVDGVQETDGVAAVDAALGASFPEGLFVAQDGDNGPENQNFKLVDWRRIEAAIGKTD